MSRLLSILKDPQKTGWPCWFMRQAGRYLPEYQAVRKDYDFVSLCQTPEMSAEVTLQPMRRFSFDASIIFSDILIPCLGIGQKLSFGKGHGPILEPAMQDPQLIDRMVNASKANDATQFSYVYEALKKVKSQLDADKTLIGFAGAPFTVASYMIEGGSSKTFFHTKSMYFQHPESYDALMQRLSDMTTEYLNHQIDAGAQVVMLFDSWAGQLSTTDYVGAAKKYVAQICTNLKKKKPDTPIIYFPGQGADRLHLLGGLGVDVISVDWRTDMAVAKERLKLSFPEGIIMQGNLDPIVLASTNERFVRDRVRAVCQQLKDLDLKRHIFNVGHGVTPHTQPDAVSWALDELRSFEKTYFK